MLWWIVGVIAVLVLLFIFAPGRLSRGSMDYMTRAQMRLDLVDRLTSEVADKLPNDQMSQKQLLRIEGKLVALWEAQQKEKTPVPEVMNEHRDNYAKLMEFAFLRIKDLRTTGGQNLDRINADFDEFSTQSVERSEELSQQRGDMHRRLGIAGPESSSQG